MLTVLLGWPYVGLVLFGVLAGWLAIEPRRPGAPARWQDPAWVLPLLWPMYLVHQFEEHGIDLLGRHYSFLESLCQTLGYVSKVGCPADPAFIFAVNAVGCQLAFACAWIFRRRNPLIAACAWGFAIVNAVAHIGPAIAHLAYNPGLLTSVLLFVPLSALMLRTVVRTGAIERRQVVRIIATGVVVHAVLLVSLKLREKGMISHDVLLVGNALNGLWPMVLGTVGVRKPAR
jgi:hypothetical protein